MSFETTLRYTGYGDRSQVEQPEQFYDSLTIPSHMLVHAEKAVSSLLYKLYEEHGGIDFYIDPELSTFSAGKNFRNEGGRLKEWHASYTDRHGSPVRENLEDSGNLRIEELTQNELEELVQNSIDIQLNTVSEQISSEIGRYEDINVEENFTPAAVIPPYLLIDDEEKLSVQKDIIEIAENESDVPLKPCFYIDLEILTDADIKSDIKEIIIEKDHDEVFLWIDDLDKNEVTVGQYQRVIEFVSLLSDHSNPHFMYGDFFSFLLSYYGLVGTSYGTFHSDYKKEKMKNIEGGYLKRYYIPQLREFYKVVAAEEILSENNTALCDCQACTERVNSWSDLIELGSDYDFLKNHHLHIRQEEKKLVGEQSLDSVLEELESVVEEYTPIMKKSVHTSPKRIKLGYLKKWVRACREVN